MGNDLDYHDDEIMTWPEMKIFSPPSFIKNSSAEKIGALPGNAWDVLTAREFLDAIGISDSMAVNRWLYRNPEGTPPFEPQDAWKVGRGCPRVIRKDKATLWATNRGKNPTNSDCWSLAASDLESLGWSGLRSPSEVQDVFTFLSSKNLLPMARRPKDPTYLLNFYSAGG